MPSTYLKIIGHLGPDAVLEIRSSYLVQRPQKPARQPAESRLEVTCVGEAGRDLQTISLWAKPYGEGLSGLAVRGHVPVPPETRRFRFLFEGRVIHELKVADAPPPVAMDWEAALLGRRPEGKRLISWQVGETEQECRAFLEYSRTDGRTWIRLTPMLRGSSCELDFDGLPGGEACRVALNVTDGVLVTRRESPRFALPVKPCRPMILRPRDGATLVAGAPVEFAGQGFYLEEYAPELEHLVWSSSEDGLLGEGRFVRANNLSTGTHTITLSAGKQGREASASITVTVSASGAGIAGAEAAV